MNISVPLFEGSRIRLGSIDYERDPEIESRWTHDPGFMRMMYTEPMRPLSIYQLKKKYQSLEKLIDERKNLFYFRIRARNDNRLLGFGELQITSWTNGTCVISLGIGSSQDRNQGLGSEALGLLLHFAFKELNLYRMTARIAEYNLPALKFFPKFGFREEVRRRSALVRDNHRWDALDYGLLANEWDQVNGGISGAQ